jgi:hypothetical protein
MCLPEIFTGTGERRGGLLSLNGSGFFENICREYVYHLWLQLFDLF